jgi:hypothetical protein
MVVRGLDLELPQLSDVAVAPDSAGDWTVDGRVFLRPSPRHNTGSDRIAHVYLEAYGLTPGGAFATTFRLEPDGGGLSFDLRFEGRAAEQDMTAMSFRLDLRDTEPGFYRMIVTVRDSERGIASLPHRTNVCVDP